MYSKFCFIGKINNLDVPIFKLKFNKDELIVFFKMNFYFAKLKCDENEIVSYFWLGYKVANRYFLTDKL